MLRNARHFPRYTRPTLDRRTFLQVVGLSGAGFMIGCSRSDVTDTAGSPEAVVELGPFIRIGTDNTVTVIIKHLDKGQGVTTGLPTIVAEELDADWSQMRSEFAPADASLYNNLFFGPFQATGGSSSVANSWMQLREAAAGARAMLVQAAAAEFMNFPGCDRHESSKQPRTKRLIIAADHAVVCNFFESLYVFGQEKMVGRLGFEPRTNELKARCSAN